MVLIKSSVMSLIRKSRFICFGELIKNSLRLNVDFFLIISNLYSYRRVSDHKKITNDGTLVSPRENHVFVTSAQKNKKFLKMYDYFSGRINLFQLCVMKVACIAVRGGRKN